MGRKKKDVDKPATPEMAQEPIGARLGMDAQAPRLRIVGLNTPEEPKPVEASPPRSAAVHSGAMGSELGDPYFSRKVRLLDFLVAVILFAGACISVLLTYKGIGHSWDEALYLRPAVTAAQWVIDLLRGDTSMLSAGAIDNAWGSRLTDDDPLHPEVAPITKTVIGLGILLLNGYGVSEMVAMRVPIAVAFGLTVALLFILGAKTYGPAAGFVGAISYWLMPRVFGHAHIAASETLFALSVVVLAWAFLGGIKRPWGAIFTAIAFALAFNTKVTALALPPALLLWELLYCRRNYSSNIVALAFGSPLVIFALWPWLWYDPLVRLAEYLRFYALHQQTAVFYMGRIWGYPHGEPAPWHYPFVITAISLPLWTLLLVVLGIGATLWQARRRAVPMLFLFLALCIIGTCALPNAPKYDGERLFFGAFPFLGILAGGGAAAVGSLISRWREKGSRLARWGQRVFILAILGAMGWNIRTLAEVHPDELNFFNSLIGGARGAYEKGFETSYWGEAVDDEVIDYLNSLTTPGTKFKPLALNELVFLNLQGWGLLSGDGIYVAASEPYDYYILQVRQGFFGNRERALHFGAKPLRVFERQGVPKIEIFSGDALTTLAMMLGRNAQMPRSKTVPAHRAQAETTSTLRDAERHTTQPRSTAPSRPIEGRSSTAETSQALAAQHDAATSRPQATPSIPQASSEGRTNPASMKTTSTQEGIKNAANDLDLAL